MTNFKKKTLKKNSKKRLMLDTLHEQLGNVTVACKQVGIARQTHYRWMEEDPNYKAWIEEIPERNLDFAENKLFGLMSEGNVAAVIFYLKTQGKSRGFIEKQEIAHTGASTTFNIIEKSVEEIKNAKNSRPDSEPKTGGNTESP